MHKLTDSEREMLTHDRARASRLQQFTESDFWNKDLKPFIMSELERSGMTKFKPGEHAPSVEQIALQFVFNSGMAGQLDRMLEQFAIWRTKGTEAAKKLVDTQEEAGK